MSKKTPRERQILDKAIRDIHTDKLQVNDVLKKVPSRLEDDLLKELRRRGDTPYPEGGLNKKGSDVQISWDEIKNNKK